VVKKWKGSNSRDDRSYNTSCDCFLDSQKRALLAGYGGRDEGKASRKGKGVGLKINISCGGGNVSPEKRTIQEPS